MKRQHLLYILLNLSVFVHAQSKHALIVAIGNYPEDSEWKNLSAGNDLALLQPTITTQGFRVTTLQDAAATKQNIIRQFQSLIQRIHTGDALFIHFSCHGQQMEDDNGDEPDGWDEALIPYDAELSYEKGVYEGENHLRDDEFNLYLIEMRKKAGPNGMVIVSLDACHSESATRDENNDEVFRGTARRFTPSGKTYEKNIAQNKHYTDTPLARGKNLAPLTVISACKSYQINWEIEIDGRFYGSLSYYLHKTLQQESLLYPQKWAPVILREMKNHTKQVPVFESTLPLKQ